MITLLISFYIALFRTWDLMSAHLPLGGIKKNESQENKKKSKTKYSFYLLQRSIKVHFVAQK